MKQQVVIIGGGNSFLTYDDYLNDLKNKQLTLDYLKPGRGWRNSIDKNLGENYQVLIPEMPNRLNAKYSEWKIVFGKILPLLADKLILIGHSLGGIFLAKYLSENDISRKVKMVILIAPPFDEEGEPGESLNDFKLSSSITNLNNYKKIFLIHSKDDQIVSYEEVEKYKKLLPKAEVITFEDRGHFNQEEFEEIVELIKKI